MTPPLRVIIETEPQRGDWNMAVDAVLLESALASDVATLRWYRWSEPTLSLGHFQAIDDPAVEGRFSTLARVRRLSGGGAILHDQEWTYSLAIGPSHPRARDASRLYRTIHESVIGVLKEFGIAAQLRGESDRGLDVSFLCFSRGDANDVVVGPHKVLGSAQRRRRGAVLQHGALLLRASAHAPEFPGLVDLQSGDLDEGNLFRELTSRTARSVGDCCASGCLNAEELIRVEDLIGRPHIRSQ